MRSSGLRDSVVVSAAAAVGIVVAVAWPHDRADRCSAPTAASIEMLFAPCLATALPTKAVSPLDPELAPAIAVPPAPPPLPPVARRGPPGDVETTGSVSVK
jgi:hypothetical protein